MEAFLSECQNTKKLNNRKCTSQKDLAWNAFIILMQGTCPSSRNKTFHFSGNKLHQVSQDFFAS